MNYKKFFILFFNFIILTFALLIIYTKSYNSLNLIDSGLYQKTHGSLVIGYKVYILKNNRETLSGPHRHGL